VTTYSSAYDPTRNRGSNYGHVGNPHGNPSTLIQNTTTPEERQEREYARKLLQLAEARKNASKNRPKNKERECLEALQNGKSDEELRAQGRFPVVMIERLSILLRTACDPDHREYIRAQLLVREILQSNTRHAKVDDEARARAAAETNKVIVNIHNTPHVDVPMPGREFEKNGAPEP
jgi:hypothetical protein